jgi:hypothetical protein
MLYKKIPMIRNMRYGKETPSISNMLHKTELLQHYSRTPQKEWPWATVRQKETLTALSTCSTKRNNLSTALAKYSTALNT